MASFWYQRIASGAEAPSNGHGRRHAGKRGRTAERGVAFRWSAAGRPPAMVSAPDSLDALADVLEALRATRSRLEKRRLLVDYLRALPDEALPLGVTYLGGRPFPRGDGRTLSVGGATLDAALRAARPEITDETVAGAWRHHA